MIYASRIMEADIISCTGQRTVYITPCGSTVYHITQRNIIIEVDVPDGPFLRKNILHKMNKYAIMVI